MIKLLEKHLATVLSSLLLFLILLCEAGELLGLKPHYILLFGSINLLLTCFCSMKLRNKIIITVSLLICIPVTILLFQWDTILAFIHDFRSWFLVCLCSGLCFFFQLLAEKLLFLRLSAAAGLTVWMIMDVFTTRQLHHLSAVCAFGYLIITYIVLTQKHWKKHKNHPKRPYLMWILPFLTCYIVLMGLMPAPSEPYDWKFVKDLYHKLLIFADNLPFVGGEDFQSAVSGFSEDGKLLGSFVQDDREIMLIQAKNDLQTNVYLTGKVYDTFTGTQWLQTNTYKERDRKLDTLETLYAVCLYEEEQLLNYVRSATLGITYLDFHTGYLFAPLKTWKVIGNDLQYTDEDGNLLFSEMHGYGTTYDSYYFQLNLDHPLFYELLEAPRTSDKEMWKQVMHRYSMAFEEKLTLTDMETHRQTIQELYGASYPLSPETKAWLEDIVGDASTDIEKLKAIEASLSSLEYTRTPGELPADIATPADFLDYFLLENKKGYCSYFATAFVLLARAEGLPARYVEGFCVPMEGTQPATVYSNQAHAWPEVYIEGVGWIPFEPTPGYAQLRYTPWAEKDYTAPPQPSEDLEEEPEEPLSTPEATSTEDTMEQEAEPGLLLQILGYLMLLLIAVLAIFFVTDKLLLKYHYHKWSPEKQFMAEIRQNLQILALLGYRRAQTETLTELQERAYAVLTYEQDGQEIRLQFLTLYEELLYNKCPVNDTLLLQVRAERACLLEALKKWKYWFYIYYKITRMGGRL